MRWYRADLPARPVTTAHPVAPDGVATLQVAPAAATLVPGTSQSLFLIVRSASGDLILGRAATWKSSDPNVVVVSPITPSGSASAPIAAAVALAEQRDHYGNDPRALGERRHHRSRTPL